MTEENLYLRKKKSKFFLDGISFWFLYWLTSKKRPGFNPNPNFQHLRVETFNAHTLHFLLWHIISLQFVYYWLTDWVKQKKMYVFMTNVVLVKKNCAYLLNIQEGLTFQILSYYIKWAKISGTYIKTHSVYKLILDFFPIRKCQRSRNWRCSTCSSVSHS